MEPDDVSHDLTNFLKPLGFAIEAHCNKGILRDYFQSKFKNGSLTVRVIYIWTRLDRPIVLQKNRLSIGYEAATPRVRVPGVGFGGVSPHKNCIDLCVFENASESVDCIELQNISSVHIASHKRLKLLARRGTLY